MKGGVGRPELWIIWHARRWESPPSGATGDPRFRAESPAKESLKVSRPACRPFRVASDLNASRLHDFDHSGTPTECVL